MPGLDYHYISKWYLPNFCIVSSDLDREEKPTFLTDGEVCDAVWVQSEKLYC